MSGNEGDSEDMNAVKIVLRGENKIAVFLEEDHSSFTPRFLFPCSVVPTMATAFFRLQTKGSGCVDRRFLTNFLLHPTRLKLSASSGTRDH